MTKNNKQNDNKAKKNKKKKSSFSLRKLIYTDKYLIIISVFLSLIIWVVTSMNVSPETTKQISVPVTIATDNTVQEQLGIKSYGEQSITVDVTVSAKKYIVLDINSEDLDVKVDTSSVTKAGYHSVPITVSPAKNNSDFTITKFYPTNYEAYFDVESEKEFPIQLNYKNKDFVADGYIMGQVQISDTNAVVRGATSYLQNVDKVVADIDIKGELTEPQTLSLDLKALNKNDKVVDYVTVSTENKNPSVIIPILKKTVLPVRVGLSNAPEGLDTSDIKIEYSVDKLEVGMLESALESTNEILLGDIDFSKLDVGKNEFSYIPSNINGITPVNNNDPITATVTVPEKYKTKHSYFSRSNIKIDGVPNGYTARVISLSNNRVKIISPDSVDNCELIPSVNLGFAPNDTINENNTRQQVNVSFDVSSSNTAWAYGTITATVEIYKSKS